MLGANNGETADAVADYTRVTEMKVAAEMEAKAISNRDGFHAGDGEITEATADFTRVIDMKDVSDESKSMAKENLRALQNDAGYQLKIPEAVDLTMSNLRKHFRTWRI